MASGSEPDVEVYISSLALLSSFHVKRTWNLLGPGDHVDQLLVGHVCEQGHHGDFGVGSTELLAGAQHRGLGPLKLEEYLAKQQFSPISTFATRISVRIFILASVQSELDPKYLVPAQEQVQALQTSLLHHQYCCCCAVSSCPEGALFCAAHP